MAKTEHVATLARRGLVANVVFRDCRVRRVTLVIQDVMAKTGKMESVGQPVLQVWTDNGAKPALLVLLVLLVRTAKMDRTERVGHKGSRATRATRATRAIPA
ncbi:MAG: hypothetical protein OXU75_14540 [Deltaproteobacteria bacterium]|nr:hypothetical protein [Deltaproteobacteria bacterium]